MSMGLAFFLLMGFYASGRFLGCYQYSLMKHFENPKS